MRGVPIALAASVLVVSVGLSSPVLAQSASEKAAAEALFDDGVKLLKAGDFEKACKKFEKSQSVDPGIGTLLYLGECYKKVGRTASAWATFREAASKASAAGEEERSRIGAQRADNLEPKLSYVTFEMPEDNLSLDGLEVVQGDVKVGRALWGTAIPVDPGELSVKVVAPGYEAFELTLTVQKGPSEATVTLPVLQPDESGPLDPPAEPADEMNQDRFDPSKDSGARPGKGRRTAGLVLGGVGLAGLGVGSVFGILALNKDGKADDVCGQSTCPDDEGQRLADDAVRFGNISTIGFAAGGALLVGGAVLYFTAPRAAESARLEVRPTFGGGQLSFTGKF